MVMNHSCDDLAHLLPLLAEIKQTRLDLESATLHYRQKQNELHIADDHMDRMRDQLHYLNTVLDRCFFHNMDPVQAKLEITADDVAQHEHRPTFYNHLDEPEPLETSKPPGRIKTWLIQVVDKLQQLVHK
jgi:hypothetical protein